MPRKSDAARKSNAATSSEAAAAVIEPTEARPPTADATADKPQAPETAAATDGAEATTATADANATATAQPTPAKDKEAKAKSSHNDAVTIEDLNMPRSIVTRLTKGVLPPTTQLQGSAITAMTRSATVFISHLANAANTLTTNAGKKTIMPADVFAALDDIEFGFLKEQLEAEFAKFNQIQTSKRTDYRKRVAAAKKGPDGQDEEAEGEGDKEQDAGDAQAEAAATARDAPPQAKKAKRAPGGKAAAAAEDEDVEMEEHEEEQEEEEEEEEEEEDDEEEEEEEEEEEDDNAAEREDAPEDDEALDSDGSE